MTEFINTGTGVLVPVETITRVELADLETRGVIRVHAHSGTYRLEGTHAVEALMRLRPACLEGRRLRWVRHAWAIHNLVGHPLMQLLAWAGRHELALRIHDATVPKPKGTRS